MSTKHPNIVNRLQHGNHIQSDVSSPQPSPYHVPSPAYSVHSQNYVEQSHAATTVNNVYSQPESPLTSSENSQQQCLDSPFIGLEQHNFHDHVPSNLLPCDSILMDPNFSSPFITSQSLDRYENDLHYINENDAGQDSCTSYETGSSEMIVQLGNGHSSLESNSTCESFASGDQIIGTSPIQADGVTYVIQMESNTLLRREPVTSTVPEQPIDMIGQQSNPDLAQILALLQGRIPDEELKNIIAHLMQGLNHGNAQTVSEMNSTSVVMTSDNTPCLTSSGSMSDAFNFRYGLVFGYDRRNYKELTI